MTWEPVSEGLHGGYIDPAAVTYKVSLNGVPAAETSGTSAPVSIDPDIYYIGYTAEVTAVYDGLESPPGVSERFLMGKAFPIPYTFGPDGGSGRPCDHNQRRHGTVFRRMDGAASCGNHRCLGGLSGGARRHLPRRFR